jgi:hypothetical protein
MEVKLQQQRQAAEQKNPSHTAAVKEPSTKVVVSKAKEVESMPAKPVWPVRKDSEAVKYLEAELSKVESEDLGNKSEVFLSKSFFFLHAVGLECLKKEIAEALPEHQSFVDKHLERVMSFPPQEAVEQLHEDLQTKQICLLPFATAKTNPKDQVVVQKQ